MAMEEKKGLVVDQYDSVNLNAIKAEPQSVGPVKEDVNARCDVTKEFVCKVCSQRFLLESDLLIHLSNHREGQMIEGDVLTGKVDLPDHMLVENGGKSYSCEVCGKAFASNWCVFRHAIVHTGEKPYTCNICNESFTYKHNLVTHSVIHTGERPFACDVCTKPFSRKQDLRRHMQIHSADKRYTCNVCNKTYAQKPYLVRHLRFHLGDKSLSCDICGKVFMRSKVLLSHRKTHDAISAPTLNSN